MTRPRDAHRLPGFADKAWPEDPRPASTIAHHPDYIEQTDGAQRAGRTGTCTPARGLATERTPVLGLPPHTCLQASHPHTSQPPSGPSQSQPPQAKSNYLGQGHTLTPIQRPGTRADHCTLTPTLQSVLSRKPAFTLPGPRRRRPRADPPRPGHLGPRFLARPYWGPPPGPGRGAAARPLRHLPGPRRPPPALSPAGPAPGAPPQPLITDRTLRPSSQRLPAAVAAAVCAPRPGSLPLVQCAAAARPPSPSATPRLRLRPREDAAAARGRRPRGCSAPAPPRSPSGAKGEPRLFRRPRPQCRTSPSLCSHLYPHTSGGLGHLRCVLVWVWRDFTSSNPAGVSEPELYLFFDSGKVAIV